MSPTKVLSWDTFYNIVDGKQRGSNETHNGIDPTTSEKLWDVPIANQQDVDDAVKAANKAFSSWSQTPFEKRKELLLKFGELCNSHSEEFTDLLCKETGKPVGNCVSCEQQSIDQSSRECSQRRRSVVSMHGANSTVR